MRSVAMVLGLLMLGGCASYRIPTQVYQEPAPMQEPPLVAKLVRLPPDAAVGSVLQGLNTSRLAAFHVDLRRGFVAVRYSGDPARYVDCGSFGFEAETVPASQQSLVLNDLSTSQSLPENFVRDLQLQTRLAIAADPYGSETSVVVDATHVLVKTLRINDEIVRSEAISFDSQSTGEFKKGTRCHSTGELEKLALEGVSGPMVALGEEPVQEFASILPNVTELEATPSWAEPSPTFRLPTQPAATEVTSSGIPYECLQLTTGAADETCELLTLLAPYRAGALGARLLVDQDKPLAEGEHLVIELDLPSGATNVQLSYIDVTGIITHLPPLKMRPDVRHSVYATGYVVSEPFGQAMILVLASPDELLFGNRPSREPLTAYLAAMKDLLREPRISLNAEAVLVKSIEG